MKVAVVIFALVGCAIAFPQYNIINAPDFSRSYLQDQAGQTADSYSTAYIQRSDSLHLIPNGQGDYVPVQKTVVQHTAPNGEQVRTVIEAGPQGAQITGSHVPRA